MTKVEAKIAVLEGKVRAIEEAIIALTESIIRALEPENDSRVHYFRGSLNVRRPMNES